MLEREKGKISADDSLRGNPGTLEEAGDHQILGPVCEGKNQRDITTSSHHLRFALTADSEPIIERCHPETPELGRVARIGLIRRRARMVQM